MHVMKKNSLGTEQLLMLAGWALNKCSGFGHCWSLNK